MDVKQIKLSATASPKLSEITAPRTAAITTGCILVPAPGGDYHRALASLHRQTEPVDCIVAIGEPFGSETARGGAAARGESVLVRWVAPSVGDNLTTALNQALTKVQTDLVFYLRSDDRWTVDHLAQMRAVYKRNPEVDFVFCDARPEIASDEGAIHPADEVDLGYTAVATYLDLEYSGGPLSCLSMRRSLANRLMPLVDDPDWHDQPEVVLALGASLAGARKCHLRRTLSIVSESVQAAQNCRAGTRMDFSYRLRLLRLVGKLARQLRLDSDFVRQVIGLEYGSKAPNDRQTFERYCEYARLHQPDGPSRRRAIQTLLATKHQLGGQIAAG